MSFLSKLFKKKKEVPKREPEEATGQSPEEGIKKETPGAVGRVIPGVLLAPRISEKTANAVQENKYVFTAAAAANKIEVKKAVEARYGVRVENVNIAKTHGKERRRGRITGWKPGLKKAIVTLQEGQKIEIQ